MVLIIYIHTTKVYDLTTTTPANKHIILSINPIRVSPAAARHRDTADKPVDVHKPRILLVIKHLTHMLIGHEPLRGEGPRVGEAIAAVAVVCNLVALDVWPYLLLEEVQVGHVRVAAAPGLDLLRHVGDRPLHAAPHAPVHDDAVVDVVAQDVDGVLGLDPVLDGNPAQSGGESQSVTLYTE